MNASLVTAAGRKQELPISSEERVLTTFAELPDETLRGMDSDSTLLVPPLELADNTASDGCVTVFSTATLRSRERTLLVGHLRLAKRHGVRRNASNTYGRHTAAWSIITQRRRLRPRAAIRCTSYRFRMLKARQSNSVSALRKSWRNVYTLR